MGKSHVDRLHVPALASHVMTAMTHDARGTSAATPARAGLLLALVSAVTFALSGALARPLLDSGWSAGSVVTLRIGIGALVVLPWGVRALAGRWHLVRTNATLIGFYGVFAVAGAQFCYFSAVRTMDVGAALLIEYTAPVAVVLWMWWIHGERPTGPTVAGIVLAALGLFLVLDVASGSGFNASGTAWALGAMVGASVYFVVSGKADTGLPPLTLAAGGLVAGGALLGVLGLVGLMPMHASSDNVTYAGLTVPPWLAILTLGVVTAAVAYVTGIAAVRRLGPRLAAFVALSEVVMAVVWAWWLLGQLPGSVQLLGGALILLGVVGVKLGESAVAPAASPIPADQTRADQTRVD